MSLTIESAVELSSATEETARYTPFWTVPPREEWEPGTTWFEPGERFFEGHAVLCEF